MTTDNAALALKVLEVFGERDPGKRRQAIRENFTEDVTFADTEEVVSGWDDLDRKVQRLLDQAPTFVFARVGEVRVVQNLTVLSWQLGPASAPPVLRGTDICFIEDGRISRLYTVLDTVPGPAPTT